MLSSQLVKLGQAATAAVASQGRTSVARLSTTAANMDYDRYVRSLINHASKYFLLFMGKQFCRVNPDLFLESYRMIYVQDTRTVPIIIRPAPKYRPDEKIPQKLINNPSKTQVIFFRLDGNFA